MLCESSSNRGGSDAPARPSPWLGAITGAAIGGAVLGAEYGLNESSLTAVGVIVAPMLGAWLAPAVRIDEQLLGRLSSRTAALAVLIGALLTPIVWSGGLGFSDLGPVLLIAAFGLGLFGVPMFGVTLLCATLWVFVVRTTSYA